MSVFLIPSLMSVYLALSTELDTKNVAIPTTLKIFKYTDLHFTSPGRPAKDPEQREPLGNAILIMDSSK